MKKGAKHSAASIAQMRASHAGLSEETRERMRQAHIGKRHSPEVLAKLSASLRGHTTSLETRIKIGAANHKPRTHGHTGLAGTSPTYQSWKAMLERCRRPLNASYKRYGGRGITICKRWLVFENFLADMGERPVGTSIDRLDNDGNYEPGNCRWATPVEQAANRRTARRQMIREELQAWK